MTDSKKIKDHEVTVTTAVTSTTEATPAPADEDSAPGPYAGLEPDRPPVSTTDAQTPIAHSLVAGAGAPHQNEKAAEEQAPAGDVTLKKADV